MGFHFFSFIIVTKMWRQRAQHVKTCCTLIMITTYTSHISHITGLATPTCTREEGKSCANKIDPTSDMSWTAVPARKPELEDKRALSPLSTKLSVKESQAQHGDWQASQEDNIMGFSYFSYKSLLSLSQNTELTGEPATGCYPCCYPCQPLFTIRQKKI